MSGKLKLPFKIQFAKRRRIRPKASRLTTGFGSFEKRAGVALRRASTVSRPEEIEMEETAVASDAPSQLQQLEPHQLAIWISGAPDPQRSALALFYLDEFSHREMSSLLELSVAELGGLISKGRQQFQAWLDANIQF